MFGSRTSTEAAVHAANENLKQNQEIERKRKEQEASQASSVQESIVLPAPPKVFIPLSTLEHPMKKSKHDHLERRLPDKFVQRFALNYDNPPEVRDPFYDKLNQVYSKNAFTMKGATDVIATDVKFESVHPEEIEQRLYSLMKFGHIVEV